MLADRNRSTFVAAMALASALGAGRIALPQEAAAPPEAQPAPAAAEPRPAVVFPEFSHDFGEVDRGRQLRHSFVVRNEGTAPLEIQGVHPT